MGPASSSVPSPQVKRMQLPFFVYGTLRPGERNHDRFLLGCTAAEEPAWLRGAVLYEGPGYPYAVEAGGGEGLVVGELVTVLPDLYGVLLRELDQLEAYVPGDPRNLYTRVVRNVLRRGDGAPVGVPAWVYLASPAVAAELRGGGALVPGGDWSSVRGA